MARRGSCLWNGQEWPYELVSAPEQWIPAYQDRVSPSTAQADPSAQEHDVSSDDEMTDIETEDDESESDTDDLYAPSNNESADVDMTDTDAQFDETETEREDSDQDSEDIASRAPRRQQQSSRDSAIQLRRNIELDYEDEEEEEEEDELNQEWGEELHLLANEEPPSFDPSVEMLAYEARIKEMVDGFTGPLPPLIDRPEVPPQGNPASIDVGPIDPNNVKEPGSKTQQGFRKQIRAPKVQVQRGTEEQRILSIIHRLLDAEADVYPEAYEIQGRLVKYIVAFLKTRYAVDGPSRWIVKRLRVIRARLMRDRLNACRTGTNVLASEERYDNAIENVDSWEDSHVSLRDRFDTAPLTVVDMLDLEAVQNNLGDYDIEFVDHVVDPDADAEDLEDTMAQDNEEMAGGAAKELYDDRSSDEEGPPIRRQRRQRRTEAERDSQVGAQNAKGDVLVDVDFGEVYSSFESAGARRRRPGGFDEEGIRHWRNGVQLVDDGAQLLNERHA